jgi:hypothetical protein
MADGDDGDPAGQPYQSKADGHARDDEAGAGGQERAGEDFAAAVGWATPAAAATDLRTRASGPSRCPRALRAHGLCIRGCRDSGKAGFGLSIWLELPESLPAGRPGTVTEAAAAVLWLASPEAGVTVGHDLAIHGGAPAQLLRRQPVLAAKNASRDAAW